MGLIFILLKTYLAVLLLRYVMTQQELVFNPIGKNIAKITDPVLNLGGKRLKNESDKLIPVLILLTGLLFGFVIYTASSVPFVAALITGYRELLVFLAQFFICGIILGSLMTYQASFLAYFYRIGSLWVNAVRKIANVRGNKAVIPAILLVFLVLIAINAFMELGYLMAFKRAVALKSFVNSGIMIVMDVIIGIAGFYIFILIVRALMSWVSPHPANPVVQIIYSVTEPVLVPIRKRIPPIGMFDLSVLILLFGLWALISLLQRLSLYLVSL